MDSALGTRPVPSGLAHQRELGYCASVAVSRAAFVCMMMGGVPLAACGNTATLSHRGGLVHEGKITAGSPDSIVFESDAGLSYASPRAEVHEIDHPGNVAATLGGIVLGHGLLSIGVAMDECRNDERFTDEGEQAGFCTGIFAPAVVGLGLLVYGVFTYSRSKAAAEDTSFPASSAAALPRPPGYDYPPSPYQPLEPTGYAPAATRQSPPAQPAAVEPAPPLPSAPPAPPSPGAQSL